MPWDVLFPKGHGDTTESTIMRRRDLPYLIGFPAIGAAGVFELRELLKHGMDGAGLTTLAEATLASAVSGYLAIDLLLRYLRRNTTYVFVWHCIGLGLLLLGLLGAGVLRPLN